MGNLITITIVFAAVVRFMAAWVAAVFWANGKTLARWSRGLEYVADQLGLDYQPGTERGMHLPRPTNWWPTR